MSRRSREENVKEAGEKRKMREMEQKIEKKNGHERRRRRGKRRNVEGDENPNKRRLLSCRLVG
jgi:hypothetical protein